MKKIFGCLAVVLMLLNAVGAAAQEGGRVILDLQPDEKDYDTGGVESVLGVGAAYWHDVKEYNELLDGENIQKDFSADIRAKYPDYSREQAEQWQNYVKKGIKAYRFYEDIKQKVISWVLNHEMPVVVPDDQYEMGESETYIESDKPLVIEDFKKIVAYSNSERDQLAAEEKTAKDYNLPRPSAKIAALKKALLEKDWKALLGFDPAEYIARLYEMPDSVEDAASEKLSAVVLSQFRGVGPDGKVAGVILLKPAPQTVVLYNDFASYPGITADFDASDNLGNIKTGLVLPQRFTVDGHKEILAYVKSFALYYEGTAQDSDKPVVLYPRIKAGICKGNDCETVELNPKVVLQPVGKTSETVFSAYVETVAVNIPRASNAGEFEFVKLVLDEGKNGGRDVVRLEIKSHDASHLRVSVIGKEAGYFAAPKMRIDGNTAIIRFEVADETFDPLGKEITFLAATGGIDQYIHKMVVRDASWFDVENNGFSAGVLLFAFIGGLLLNIMPCGLSVLAFKLMSLTGFGGRNRDKIRRRFGWTGAGIFFSFVVAAVWLAGLKLGGYPLGWGIQFQNVYFIGAMIWGVMLFWLYVIKIIGLPAVAGSDAVRHKNCWTDFGSGIFAALLSTGCTAPYLAEAVGTAMAGSAAEIAAAVMAAGAGLALPYVLIMALPDTVAGIFRTENQRRILQKIVVILLPVSLIWLIGLAAAQSKAAEIWHWLLYLTAAFAALSFRKTVQAEIDKLDDAGIAAILRRRTNIFFGIVMLLLTAVSLWDLGSAAAKRRSLLQDNVPSVLNRAAIDENVRRGMKVLVKVNADWCLLCKYNDIFVLNIEHVKNSLRDNGVKVFETDWSGHDQDVLAFMRTFGRSSLPFYVLFSPTFPDGIVLPKILNDNELRTLIDM